MFYFIQLFNSWYKRCLNNYNYLFTIIQNCHTQTHTKSPFPILQGTIEIDMKEKKLELIVIPQHGSQGLTTTSNLSGGERSFSTVAFLYSLWQCMEFPFYFLDEFDVYMVILLIKMWDFFLTMYLFRISWIVQRL